MKKQLIASAIAIALGTIGVVSADETSSSIRGQISTPQGAPAANTTIIITHVPTGTQRRFTTNEQGSFNASGLPVGGPYTILIDSDTYQDKEITNVQLELGNPFVLREVLQAITGEVVTITASASDFRYPNSGSNSSFGSREIEGSPSVNRDLKSVLRRNPLVNVLDNDEGSMSVAGSNPRYNSITIDGIRQDDDFGLNGSGYPTQRSPISLDAVEQISIATNPYDASKGGFSGAGISVVTKSGTNEFSGNVFYEYFDDKFAGPSRESGASDVIPTAFTERTYGFSVGGPIIADKLFFFANYEKFEAPGTVEAGPDGYPSGNPADVSIADANEVIRIAREIYGVEPGTWELGSIEEDVKKLLKVDWNINDYHRASFTYQDTDGKQTSNNVGGRTLNLSSHWYTRGDHLRAYSAQWFADWSNNFATELRIADKSVDNTQDPLEGRGYGQVSVRTPSGTVEFGPDRSRHANELRNDTFQVAFEAEYLSGDHTWTFGYVYDDLDVYNVFVQDSLGSWSFDSLADFENRDASEFNYQNSFLNSADDAAAIFNFKTHTFYVGDVWDVNADLILNYGLRYERITTSDTPRLNPNFVNRYGFGNDASMDGKDILLPRIGFDYQVAENVKLSGGIGRFSGGRPNVWLSNAYTNDGVTIVVPDVDTNDPQYLADVLTNVDVTSIPTYVTDRMVAGNGNSTPIDPNFDIPSEWRYSLKADWNTSLGVLGDNWLISSEAIFKDIDKDVQWIDLAREQIGTTVAGQPIYGPVDANNPDQYDLLLTNISGGDSRILTFSMDKQWDNGLHLNLSYTNQDINDRVPGTSSTATSNYQYTTTYDRQNPAIATASYEVKHRLALNLDYDVEIFNGLNTTFGLFAERVSGRPYSWTLGSFRDGDLGDQSDFDDSDVYLPYIPTGPNEPAVDFSCNSCLSYDEIIDHLNDNGISTSGGFLSRNAYRSPYKTNIDLFIRQEVPGLFNDQKGEVYFHIDNLLNLVDSSQGKIYSNPFGESQQILFDYDVNQNGQYQYQEPFGDYRYGSPANFREIKSAWRVKVGVRYKF